MAIIFDGRKFGAEKERELKKEVNKLYKKGVTPRLVSILVGDNPASKLYVSLKKKAAERIGAEAELISLGANLEEILQTIELYNKDNSVYGIMVQLPLPLSLKKDTQKILEAIAPEKDVDGLRGNSGFVPATVKGILQIIEEAKTKLGHDFESVAVVGAKGMVGKPLVKILKILGYNVVGCDISTSNLSSNTLTANLLISAAGVPGLIKGGMVKKGAAVIDVGSPKGDVNFEEVSKKAAFITPVPGGVGPMTIVSLLENLLIATRNSI